LRRTPSLRPRARRGPWLPHRRDGGRASAAALWRFEVWLDANPQGPARPAHRAVHHPLRPAAAALARIGRADFAAARRTRDGVSRVHLGLVADAVVGACGAPARNGGAVLLARAAVVRLELASDGVRRGD